MSNDDEVSINVMVVTLERIALVLERLFIALAACGGLLALISFIVLLDYITGR